MFFFGLNLLGKVLVASVERGSFKNDFLKFFSEFMLLPEHKLNVFLLGDRLLMQLEIVVVLLGC